MTNFALKITSNYTPGPSFVPQVLHLCLNHWYHWLVIYSPWPHMISIYSILAGVLLCLWPCDTPSRLHLDEFYLIWPFFFFFSIFFIWVEYLRIWYGHVSSISHFERFYYSSCIFLIINLPPIEMTGKKKEKKEKIHSLHWPYHRESKWVWYFNKYNNKITIFLACFASSNTLFYFV